MKNIFVVTMIMFLVSGCAVQEEKQTEVVKEKWPLYVTQAIQVGNQDSVFYMNDLLLRLDTVLEIVPGEGFEVDWDRQSGQFTLSCRDTVPSGGALTIITDNEKISYPLIGNGPIENLQYYTGERMLSATDADSDEVKFNALNKDVQAVFLHNNEIAEVDRLNDNELSVKIPASAQNYTRSYLRGYAWTANGWGQDVLIPLENGKVVHDASDLDRKDFHAQRMYFVLMDRFNNGSTENDEKVNDDRLTDKTNFHGGDIKGITEKIRSGYFDSLHINSIWLSPITQNPQTAWQEFPEPRRWYSGYHGYWPVRSGKVDHRFGNEEDLRELVAVAHEHDINILLDYICNHVHKEHPIYQANPDIATIFDLPDGRKNIRFWDEHRLTTWFDDFLPSLDLSDPEIIELQSDSALFWIKEFGLDGFRHDATKHIPEAFWKTLTRKIKDSVILMDERPVYQIGETYSDADLIAKYIGNGLLDAQFDFNLFFTARDELAKENGDLNAVAERMNESMRFYGFHNTMGYISGNHDQPRFTAYASGALSFDEDPREAGFSRYVGIDDSIAYSKMAQLVAFNNAIPGIPVVYYGDEIGMSGAGDPDNRRPMRFENWSEKERELWHNVSEINKLRASEMALTYGDLEILFSSEKALVLKRQYFDNELLFVLNIGDNPFSFVLPMKDSDKWKSSVPHFNNAKIMKAVSGNTEIELPAHSFDFIIK